MDILILVCMIGIAFSSFFLIEDKVKIYKICLSILLVIILSSICFLMSFTTIIENETYITNHLKIGDNLLEFDKPVKITKVIIKPTYSLEMIDKTIYKINNGNNF